MSELEDMEGRLLSESFGVGGPPARPLAVIEAELDLLKQDTRQKETALLCNYIEIGRRLAEAKAQLHHGQWGDWLKEKEFSQSTANNFMRLFREYGADQQSLFGGVVKSQTFANLTVSKALSLLAIPDGEERERFAAEHDVEHMSTRELDKAIKERDEAEEKAIAAKEETVKIRREADRLKEQLESQAQVYEAKLTSAGVEAEQARQAHEKAAAKAQKLQEKLSEANAAAQAAEEEQARLVRELEELRSRPVDAAVEADPKVLKAVRQATINEMTEKVKTANELMYTAQHDRDAAQEALVAAQKELAELKAGEPEARELTQEEKDALTAEAVERARAGDAEQIRDLKKQLTLSDQDTAAFKALFETWQRTFWDMMEALKRIYGTDIDKAEKLKDAVRAVTERLMKG